MKKTQKDVIWLMKSRGREEKNSQITKKSQVTNKSTDRLILLIFIKKLKNNELLIVINWK